MSVAFDQESGKSSSVVELAQSLSDTISEAARTGLPLHEVEPLIQVLLRTSWQVVGLTLFCEAGESVFSVRENHGQIVSTLSSAGWVERGLGDR